MSGVRDSAAHTAEVSGVTLYLAHPDELSVAWVGQQETMKQLLAAWYVVDGRDLPMSPRLLGKPGVGKTTIASNLAVYLRALRPDLPLLLVGFDVWGLVSQADGGGLPIGHGAHLGGALFGALWSIAGWKHLPRFRLPMRTPA